MSIEITKQELEDLEFLTNEVLVATDYIGYYLDPSSQAVPYTDVVRANIKALDERLEDLRKRVSQ